jgi:two-component system invasion response regulator UvrY
MKILLVDDHAVIHFGLERVLCDEFAGAICGKALHAQEALDLVLREHWDVVVLDVDLPGRGGLDVLKLMRAAQPRLPVIMFSMHSEDQFAIRSLKAGASAYLAKDSPSAHLVAAIRKVIRGGRYVSPELAEKLATDLSRDQTQEPHEILSNREFEVMRLIAGGKTPTAMADAMSLSVKTVSTYRSRILDKLQLETTSQLIRYAIEHGLDH